MHHGDLDRADDLAAEAERSLREAQEAVAPFPVVAHAGFLHDAEKEYAEARLTVALVAGTPLPDPGLLEVGPAAWLRGLAEAASELRRNLLDRLRAGDLARAETLLGAMEAVYEALVQVDEPDAVTGGLRRTVDALRAVIERSRADVTTAVVQERVRRAVEGAGGSD